MVTRHGAPSYHYLDLDLLRVTVSLVLMLEWGPTSSGSTVMPFWTAFHMFPVLVHLPCGPMFLDTLAWTSAQGIHSQTASQETCLPWGGPAKVSGTPPTDYSLTVTSGRMGLYLNKDNCAATNGEDKSHGNNGREFSRPEEWHESPRSKITPG